MLIFFSFILASLTFGHLFYGVHEKSSFHINLSIVIFFILGGFLYFAEDISGDARTACELAAMTALFSGSGFIVSYLLTCREDYIRLTQLIYEINTTFGEDYDKKAIWNGYRFYYSSKIEKLINKYHMIWDEETHVAAEERIEHASHCKFDYIYACLSLDATMSSSFNFELFEYCERHLLGENSPKVTFKALVETSYLSYAHFKSIPSYNEDGSKNEDFLDEVDRKKILSFLCRDYAKEMYLYYKLSEELLHYIEESRINAKSNLKDSLADNIDYIYDIYISILENQYIH